MADEKEYEGVVREAHKKVFGRLPPFGELLGLHGWQLAMIFDIAEQKGGDWVPFLCLIYDDVKDMIKNHCHLSTMQTRKFAKRR